VGQPQDGQGPLNNFARIFTSPDGIHWTRRVGANNSAYSVATGERELVAIALGQGTVLLRSMTGVEWAETQPLDYYLYGIAFGGGVYVAAGDSGIFTSPDGAGWSKQSSAGLGWSRLRYGAGKFLAL